MGDLCLVAAVELELVLLDTRTFGDLGDRQQPSRLRDLETPRKHSVSIA